MLRIRGKHWRTALLCDLLIEHTRIVEMRPANHGEPADFQADWLAPAFFDLQINGGYGTGFTSAALSVDGIRAVVDTCQTHGIAAFCPTVVTNDFATLAHAFKTLRNAVGQDATLEAAMPLFHLEGPYISAEDGPRGAHPRRHTRPPDEEEFQRLQEAAGGRIGLITLAPELPGALPFIERRTAEGVVVSLGHSQADPATIRAAVAAGARLSTHLGNGCPRHLPRHENLIWEQLAADALSASLITDGFHLPWSLVRCMIRCKRPERVILTCDASEMAGLPPGRYGQWEQQVEVTADGKIVLLSQGVLAGSWAFTDLCIQRLARQRICTLPELIAMATANPLRLLGLPAATLEAGQLGNVVLLQEEADGGLRLVTSVIRGQARPGPTSAAAC